MNTFIDIIRSDLWFPSSLSVLMFLFLRGVSLQAFFSWFLGSIEGFLEPFHAAEVTTTTQSFICVLCRCRWIHVSLSSGQEVQLRNPLWEFKIWLAVLHVKEVPWLDPNRCFLRHVNNFSNIPSCLLYLCNRSYRWCKLKTLFSF